jgi:hypothetical protein
MAQPKSSASAAAVRSGCQMRSSCTIARQLARNSAINGGVNIAAAGMSPNTAFQIMAMPAQLASLRL